MPHCATTLVFLPRAIGEEVSAKHFIEKRGDVGEGSSFALVDADVERDRQPFAGVDAAHAAQIHAGEAACRTALLDRLVPAGRSEERRVVYEGISPVNSRWSPYT